MASISSRFEQENSGSDKIAKLRPAWWHVGKVVFGVLLVVKSAGLALNATGAVPYLLAGVLLVAGLGLACEGIGLLRLRIATARTSGPAA